VLEAGTILVAPPDHHLLLLDGRVSLTRGPQENGHRPAVDVLFRSAARGWDGRVVAVVLSGTLDDGAAGAVSVSRGGGHCLVQDPEEALHAGMPRAAAAVVECEVGVVAELSHRIAEVVAEIAARPDTPATPAPPAPPGSTEPASAVPSLIDTETLMADLDPATMHDHDRPGEPSGYGCPDCAGALFEMDDGPMRRFRCRVGHAWSPQSLIERQTAATESALWMALRSLEEKAALNAEMAERARARGTQRTADRFEAAAQEATDAAELVRQMLEGIDDQLRTQPDVPAPPAPDEPRESAES
jgi:two-component system chemotaxis response regulator CheB